MSCSDCEEMQRGDMTAPYRWGIANIEVRACNVHAKEVFDALNRAQIDTGEGGGNDLKYGPLEIPGIPKDEPVFVLRAQDAHAIYIIEEYQRLAGSHSTAMAESLDLTLRRFRSWTTRKLPD